MGQPQLSTADARTEGGGWFEAEARRLLRFGEKSVAATGGAYWLDFEGAPDTTRPIASWISARMAYVFGLASAAGDTHAKTMTETTLAGFLPASELTDARHEGWFDAASATDLDKTAYTHAFIVLAAAAGVAGGVESASALLTAALDVVDGHFWDEQQGLARDSISPDWSTIRDYRGLNANMHLLEAYLTAGDLGDSKLHERAVRISLRAADWARQNSWRLPEHFTSDWSPVLEYNGTARTDPFKPYGSTPGHGYEWARLMMQASLLPGIGSHDAKALRGAARNLYSRASIDGWARRQSPGFLYTVDWAGEPAVDSQLHWVAAEAVSAASIIGTIDDDERRVTELTTWWSHIRDVFVDEEHGSWIHELDAEGHPGHTIWAGKPDIYHAYQACVLPTLAPAPSLLGAIKARSDRMCCSDDLNTGRTTQSTRRSTTEMEHTSWQ